MTKPKTTTPFYAFVRGAVSNALALEYVIRATESCYPDVMNSLREIDKQIRSAWIKVGATEHEIAHEQLMDYAWDTVQIGFPLVKRHNQLIGRKLRDLIETGCNQILHCEEIRLDNIKCPAILFYRVADLLNGNDIVQFIDHARSSVKHVDQETSLKDLLHYRIREPIPLHPGISYVQSQSNGPDSDFGILINLKTAFETNSFMRQIQEFLYQYALYRGSLVSNTDKLSHDLINAYLHKDLHASYSEHSINRQDGLASALSGLYCWDKVHREGGTLTSAIESTQIISPRSPESVKKNYKETKQEITKAVKMLKSWE